MKKPRKWITSVLIGGFLIFLFCLSIPLGNRLILNWAFPTVAPPTYTAQESARNCLFLPNADQQLFCRDGGDAVAFNQALKQSFPADKATYVDIMKYFGHLQTRWWADLNCYEESTKRSMVGTCPKPQFCEKGTWYTCRFISIGENIPEISITVNFEMTGIVKSIGADGLPNDS